MNTVAHRLVDPKTYGSPDELHEILTKIRKEDPIYWMNPEGYRPFWLLTRHADVSEVERKNNVFLNAPRINLHSIEEEARLASARHEGQSQLLRSMNGMDGNEHKRTREVTQNDFLRPNVEKLADQVDAIAREFVDRMATKGPDLDFMRDIARWYPLRVVMMLLGVPNEDEARLLQLTEQLFGVADPDVQKHYGQQKPRHQTIEEFFDYFRPLLDDRRKQPRDDIASRIANAQIDGKPIGEFEALSYCVTVATAGHDTTAASLAGGVLAFIQNPKEWEKLRANPDHLKTAPDEMIRWVVPVKHFFRTASEDYRLGDKLIRKGDSLMLSYASACRDEAVYEDPFVFKIDRSPNRHLAMGDGVHVCLGQHLARLELRLFLKHLIDRNLSIKLAGQPSWVEGCFISGLKRLDVTIG